ncbi:hypothetical protein HRbin01_01279 [archaeon HR01]|nr:hypothetical protein HRbin01_01279 [archaeon HR01]
MLSNEKIILPIRPRLYYTARRAVLSQRFVVSAALIIIAALSWIFLIITPSDSVQMFNMVTMMGYEGIGLFLLTWMVMMVAMMLPSAAPMVQAYVSLTAEKQTRTRWVSMRAASFIGSYIFIWTALGLVVAAAYFVLWDKILRLGTTGDTGAAIAGAALVVAGFYQLTPLKQVCLKTCRSPIHFLMTRYRQGLAGALSLGLYHAGYCIGCCWLLFVVLFNVGVMSLPWMALLSVIIFFEKNVPGGKKASYLIGFMFIVFGFLLITSPELGTSILMAGK